jgi:hypothetical protein
MRDRKLWLIALGLYIVTASMYAMFASREWREDLRCVTGENGCDVFQFASDLAHGKKHQHFFICGMGAMP